jgi:hypothetical protein
MSAPPPRRRSTARAPSPPRMRHGRKALVAPLLGSRRRDGHAFIRRRTPPHRICPPTPAARSRLRGSRARLATSSSTWRRVEQWRVAAQLREADAPPSAPANLRARRSAAKTSSTTSSPASAGPATWPARSTAPPVSGSPRAQRGPQLGRLKRSLGDAEVPRRGPCSSTSPASTSAARRVTRTCVESCACSLSWRSGRAGWVGGFGAPATLVDGTGAAELYIMLLCQARRGKPTARGVLLAEARTST